MELSVRKHYAQRFAANFSSGLRRTNCLTSIKLLLKILNFLFPRRPYSLTLRGCCSCAVASSGYVPTYTHILMSCRNKTEFLPRTPQRKLLLVLKIDYYLSDKISFYSGPKNQESQVFYFLLPGIWLSRLTMSFFFSTLVTVFV